MGGGSKGISVFLRFWQIISDAIVLGIVASFLQSISLAGVYADARLIYTICVASVGIIFSVVVFFPFNFSFLAFPLDAALAILWLVVFCLLEALTGVNTCNSSWYLSYWGYFWGGFWRTPRVVRGPADIGWAGCQSWRAVLAWSFISFFVYLLSAILGIFAVSKYQKERRFEKNQRNSAPLESLPAQNGQSGPQHAVLY